MHPRIKCIEGCGDAWHRGVLLTGEKYCTMSFEHEWEITDVITSYRDNHLEILHNNGSRIPVMLLGLIHKGYRSDTGRIYAEETGDIFNLSALFEIKLHNDRYQVQDYHGNVYYFDIRTGQGAAGQLILVDNMR